MTYYITLPSGMQDVAASLLTRATVNRHKPVADRVITRFDGGVLFSSSLPPSRIAALGFVQNAFYVARGVRDMRDVHDTKSARSYGSAGESRPTRKNRPSRRSGRGSSPRSAREVRPQMSAVERLAALALSLSFDPSRFPRGLLAGCRSVRLVTSSGGRLVSIDRSLRRELEAVLARALGLSVQPAGADLELWIIERTEGSGIIGFRLTTRRATEQDLEKGELRPELANLLCHLSEPQAEDWFLDPFCGSGAIGAERMRMAPFARLFAGDADPSLASRTELRLKGILQKRIPDSEGDQQIVVRHADARRLSFVPDSSVTAVVTDPPWGAYETTIADPAELYRAFLDELARVLSPHGRAVFLVGRDGPMAGLLGERPEFTVRDSYDILVGGKKATVLTARRTPAAC